jgi:Leucine-rich repeat (LRR) protein
MIESTSSYTVRGNILDLSRNSLKQVGRLFEEPFLFLPVFFLDLSGNCFESVEFSFSNLEDLRYLYLQENKIAFLVENAFESLKQLLQLDISMNRLTAIQRNTFKSLTTLENLNISSNSIEIIHSYKFEFNCYLITLDMSGNLIENIHSHTFGNLIYLKNLHLQLNHLKTISKLDSLISIRNICLDNTLIVEGNFSNVVSLKQSIQVQLYKKSLDINYLKSINVIMIQNMTQSRNMTSEHLSAYCNATLFLVKHNISLNLKTDDEFNSFFSLCVQYAHDYMFIESSLD